MAGVVQDHPRDRPAVGGAGTQRRQSRRDTWLGQVLAGHLEGPKGRPGTAVALEQAEAVADRVLGGEVAQREPGAELHVAVGGQAGVGPGEEGGLAGPPLGSGSLLPPARGLRKTWFSTSSDQ